MALSTERRFTTVAGMPSGSTAQYRNMKAQMGRDDDDEGRVQAFIDGERSIFIEARERKTQLFWANVDIERARESNISLKELLPCGTNRSKSNTMPHHQINQFSSGERPNLSCLRS